MAPPIWLWLWLERMQKFTTINGDKQGFEKDEQIIFVYHGSSISPYIST
jgi:hypothetical protein